MIRLYLITPPTGDPAPAIEAALAVLPRGSVGVQLRHPGSTAQELLGRARTLREICARSGAPFLVNDRADVAMAAGADGLHLPARGLSSADARALGIGLVGVSAHSAEDVARASREGADFAVFAPVYDTPGKSGRGEAALASACRAAPIPVLALGGVNETNARRCIEAGSDALAVINTIMGMAIDVDSRRPIIGNIQGGLSGPAIKPTALLKVHQVYEVARRHHVPIIGQGGITTATDALEFIIAGASAVGIGTSLFYDPMVCKKINAGIREYLESQHLGNIEELVGTLRTGKEVFAAPTPTL